MRIVDTITKQLSRHALFVEREVNNKLLKKKFHKKTRRNKVNIITTQG